jgi:hypothetical protein
MAPWRFALREQNHTRTQVSMCWPRFESVSTQMEVSNITASGDIQPQMMFVFMIEYNSNGKFVVISLHS